MRFRWTVLLALLGVSALATHAVADRRYFLQSYTPYLAPAGEVELEIVVRRDGSVGDVKILRGLGGGLNERAVQAVRQWRFAPAQRQGAVVDVVVEVAVEFRLR